MSFRISLLALSALLLFACEIDESASTQDSGAGGSPEPAPGAEEFLSANPYHPRSSNRDNWDTDGGMASSVDAGMAGGGGEAGSGGEQGEERGIEEADILKLVGERLYALSLYRGLLIVDLSNPEDLQILGRHQTYGQPFEMYLRDGIAYIIFSSYWSYEWDPEEGGELDQSTRILLLDVEDPEAIEELGLFELQGRISDSRLVGDVLYAVTQSNCWDCYEQGQETLLSSLNIEDPQAIHIVDQLSIPGESWYQRSIHVNEQRIYISSFDWDHETSEIQVADISDPSGLLREGASLPIQGVVQSRWQMSEHRGIFRVISQPSGWNNQTSPKVETFQVNSSEELLPLGELSLELPRPESLQSVRFDGDRAYAVTFERTDPLFVIDLKDPAQPKQRGALEIPGWLYHMEPRGDRLLAIGFDEREASSLAVSLFDVSDMDHPSMLSRVNFGAEWGYMPEDQDRIHKAFKILDEHELILMPFAGWSTDFGYESYDQYHSGVQLIGWSDDRLSKRGVAPHHGNARRSFIKNDQLFALSDERIEAFNISNRDQPRSIDTLLLARTVYRMVQVGEYIVQLSSDWWSGELMLDINPIEAPDQAEPLTRLNIDDLVEQEEEYYGYFYYGNSRLFAHGDRVSLVWEKDWESIELLTFDLSNPLDPRLLAHNTLAIHFPYQEGWWGQSTVESGESILMIGDRLIIRGRERYYDYRYDCDYDDGYDRGHDCDYEEDEKSEAIITGSGEEFPFTGREELIIIDLSRPEEPQIYGVDLPSDEPVGALMAVENLLLSSHLERLDEREDQVRFYLDRVDLSGEKPRLLSKVNIPGSLISLDPSNGRMITVDYQIETFAAEGWESCYERWGERGDWDMDGVCYRLNRSINLLSFQGGERAQLLERHSFSERPLYNIQLSGEQLFVELREQEYYWSDSSEEDPRPLLQRYRIQGESLSLEGELRMMSPWTWLYKAQGDQAIILSDSPPALFIYEGDSEGQLQVVQESLLTGYGYDVIIGEEVVLSANATAGVQRIPLRAEP